MSSRAGKLEKKLVEMPKVETKEMRVRIDVIIEKDHQELPKSTYMLITGIPKDLPAEYENTVIQTAEKQFSTSINQRMFMEFYTQGKSVQDEQPQFINMMKIDSLKVTKVEKVEA